MTQARFPGWKARSLSQRLIFWTICFSGALALVITVVQLLVEYRRDIATVEQRFALIQEGYLPSIVDTVWVADRQHLTTLLDGIVRLPDFAYAEVGVDGQVFAARGRADAADGLTRHWTLMRNYRGRDIEIGELTIKADLAAARERFVERAVFIVAANLVKTMLVALFMLALADRLVVRHLERMAAALAEKSPERFDPSLTLDREPRDDELQRLVDALNRLHAELAADRSRLRQSEAELEQRVAARTAELQLANKDLESFAYSVSHDLQAPLRAMGGFSNILMEDERQRLSYDGRQMLDRIAANAQRMSAMIDRILDYSRAGRQPLKKGQVDMAALAGEVAARLKPAYPGADLRIGPLPPAVGDATMIEQILQNLIGNALKYSAKVAQPRIEVGADVDGARTVYWVQDNGAGFDMRYADKLFGAFQRMHAEGEFPGTGLGLAIVKRLVERHGGEIRAAAEPERGAKFSFTLG
ncbi:MAG TPA: ATP-binding protein [Rhodocyclaceae bacterium]